jgi:hypothetical protein
MYSRMAISARATFVFSLILIEMFMLGRIGAL